MKVGDIIYTKRKEYWHDVIPNRYPTNSNFHNVQPFEKFKILKFKKK